MTSPHLLAYFGHHKCASQYIQSIIQNVSAYLSLSVHLEAVPQKLPGQWHLKDAYSEKFAEVAQKISEFDYDFLCHGNAEVGLLELLSQREYRGFHVVRDPRDMLISGYFSHKNSHNVSKSPWMAEHRDRLQSLNLEDGLMTELDYSSVYFDAIAEWDYENPHIFETNFETLTGDPVSEFLKIFTFLGIEISENSVIPDFISLKNKVTKRFWRTRSGRLLLSERVFHAILDKHAFEKKSGGRKPGKENHRHHYRKGVAGDWQNYFYPKLAGEFKTRYGHLLIQLGYETDLDW